MRVYTSHLKTGREPVLVAEGGSLLAGLFGWLWMLANGAYLPALVLFGAEFLASRLSLQMQNFAPVLALMLLQGAFASDIRRISLSLRGFSEGPVVAGANDEAAFARLLDQHPELLDNFSRARAGL